MASTFSGIRQIIREALNQEAVPPGKWAANSGEPADEEDLERLGEVDEEESGQLDPGRHEAEFYRERGLKAMSVAQGYASRSDYLHADNTFMRAYGYFNKASTLFAKLGDNKSANDCDERAIEAEQSAFKHRSAARREGARR
jgi:hypothetical protein